MDYWCRWWHEQGARNSPGCSLQWQHSSPRNRSESHSVLPKHHATVTAKLCYKYNDDDWWRYDDWFDRLIIIIIIIITRMRGKAQRDGRPGVELIETLVLLSLIAPKYTCNAAFRLITSCCHRKISGINLCLSTSLPEIEIDPFSRS